MRQGKYLYGVVYASENDGEQWTKISLRSKVSALYTKEKKVCFEIVRNLEKAAIKFFQHMRGANIQ